MGIRVLALQGGLAEYIATLSKLGTPCVEIRKEADFDGPLDVLIFPNGESTVVGKLLHRAKLSNPIQERIQKGVPVRGTCVGLILLADTIINKPNSYFKGVGLAVRGNAYGRQFGSSYTEEGFRGIGRTPMTLIRTPLIESMGKGVTPLSLYDRKIITAENDTTPATTFYPELTDDTRILEYLPRKAEQQAIRSPA